MTTSQWVNTAPDAGALPELLLRLAASIPPAAIDELWIFPTRRIAIGESTVLVVARFDPDEPARRRVITARFAVTRDRRGAATVQEKLDEHATTQEGALARIIHGVLRRLGEEGEQPPRTEKIEGDAERWWALVEELGGSRPAPEPEPVLADPPSDPDTAAGGPPADRSADPAPTAGAPGPVASSDPDSAAGAERAEARAPRVDGAGETSYQ